MRYTIEQITNGEALSHFEVFYEHKDEGLLCMAGFSTRKAAMRNYNEYKECVHESGGRVLLVHYTHGQVKIDLQFSNPLV